MASLFNSKHNKYVSIPDWFKDVKPVEEQKIETKTTYIGGGGVSSISGLSNITIYNKFVLKDAELDNEALIIKDIALNGIETEEHKIGDEISAIGWNTTEYTSIAGSSTMTVTSTIIENQYGFGVFFYDNALSHISNVVLQNTIEEVIVPANAYYFRISVPANDESFNVRYNRSEAYNSEQLALSDKNVTDYLTLNDLIPEGKNETVVSGNSLKLLVQSPLSLTKDINNVVKLSIGNIIKESSNDMFVWDKKLAAFGYDDKTGTAYSYVEGEQQFTTDSQGNQVPVTTDNPEFWMYDEALSDKWIIKSTRPRISWLDNLIEYDEEKNYFKLHGDLLVTGGVTMYATKEDDPEGGGGEGDEDDPELPENMEQVIEELKKTFVTTTEEVQDIEGVKNFLNGLSIGTRRMYEWKDDVIYLDSNLVVRGGITMYGNTGDVEPNEWYTSLPVADPLYWDYSSGSPVLSLSDAIGSIDSISVTGEGNAITGAVLTDNGKSISFTKSIKFATFDELQKKADKEYVDQNFVTLKGDPQTIESQKNFTGGLLVNGNEIVYDTSTNCWKLDGNLLVSGGITMYNINPASIPSFMQSLLLDDKTLELNDAGELTVKGGATGGIDEDQLLDLLDQWGYVKDTESLKNPYSLSWSGYSSGSYDGSSTKSITIPNNTNQLTNGAGYITASALGAYLPLTGGTLTGDLRLKDSTNYGRTIYFGDDEYVYITEDSDDHLTIFANSGIELATDVTVNKNLDVLGSMKVKGTKFQAPAGSDTRGFEFAAQYCYVHWDYASRERIFHLDGNNVVVFAKVPQVTGNGSLATQPWVKQNYITSIANVKNTEGGATFDRYLGITKNDSTTNLTVGYAVNSRLIKAYSVSDLSTNSAWNTTAGMCCNYFASNASNIPAKPGNNANGVISFMTTWNYGFQIGYLNSLSTGYETIPHLYFRNFVNGSYKSWYRIVTNGPQMTFEGINWDNPYMRMRYQNGSWYYVQMRSDGMWLGISNTNGIRIDVSGNLLVTGGITMYSDLRKKTILNNVELTLEQIANAPIIEYYYNSDKQKTTHVGSSAQYWANINNWFCKENDDGYYTMEIQNLALTSSISVARELIRYESNTDKQIRELKEKIIELENRLKQYEYGSNT